MVLEFSDFAFFFFFLRLIFLVRLQKIFQHSEAESGV